MATLNPLTLLALLKNGNPQAVVHQIIQQNYANDPIMQQLLEMGKKGDYQSIEQFAQQFFAQSGRDFNQEMKSFMDMMKGL